MSLSTTMRAVPFAPSVTGSTRARKGPCAAGSSPPFKATMPAASGSPSKLQPSESGTLTSRGSTWVRSLTGALPTAPPDRYASVRSSGTATGAIWRSFGPDIRARIVGSRNSSTVKVPEVVRSVLPFAPIATVYSPSAAALGIVQRVSALPWPRNASGSSYVWSVPTWRMTTLGLAGMSCTQPKPASVRVRTMCFIDTVSRARSKVRSSTVT